MKRALAICTAVMLFGVASFGLSISGSWEGEINLIGGTAPTLTSTTLTLVYTVNGLDITSTSGFNGSGFTTQTFGLEGDLGLIALTGSMAFDPTVPAYKSMSLTASMDLLGAGITANVSHWDTYYMTTTPVLCDVQTPSQGQQFYMTYGLGLVIDPFGLDVTFEDCCDGIVFKDLVVTLSDVGLCCGITYDFELSFLKSGFDYAKFTFNDLFTLMDFVTFDVSITYGVDYKTVSITPEFGPFATTCVEIYGDWIWNQDGVEDDLYIEGLVLHGFKIYCELDDCNYAEFVTFLSPSEAPDAMGFTEITDGESDVTVQEFEYFKLGFCGPGCCGGNWNADISVYFHDTAGVSLFAISRLAANFSVPVMENLIITTTFSTDAINGTTTLDLGWTFTF
ncbi:MAG: hypothetical protein R6U88_02725 [Candidatus Bipolaricaulota bacterium]